MGDVVVLALVSHELSPYRRVFAYLVATPISLHIVSFCVGEFYRLVHRIPALIVDDDGVIDNCSYIVRGVGRIRWKDMRSVVPMEEFFNESRGRLRLYGPHLLIGLRDRDAFIGGLPRTIRLLRWTRRPMDGRWGDISI